MKKYIFFVASFFAFSIHAEDLSPDTVVVQRGSAVLTLADVDAYVEQRIPLKDRAGFMNSPKRIESLLLSMLLHRQLADDARNLQLDKDEAVQRRIRVLTDQILAQKRLEEATKNLQIPDMEALARETYAAKKSQYVEPGRVDVKHILIDTKTRTAKEALDLANNIVEQARKNPDDFDNLVKKYSNDSTKDENGGLIENATSSRYEKAFVAGVKELQAPGDISHPIRSSFGIHVIKLISREPDRQKSFDEVRDTLVSQLSEEYVDQRRRDVRDKFANEKMDANPEAVASLRERYNKPVSVQPETPVVDGTEDSAK